MQTLKTCVKAFLIILIIGRAGEALAGAQGIIFGTVGLELEDSGWTPGSMIRVCLVSSAVSIQQTASVANPRQRMAQINSAHLNFYKSFRNREHNRNYLLASVISGEGGTFTFKNVPPGQYFILVTFPSMIGGRKVAWQLPVDTEKAPYVWVQLNRSNLALPAPARYSPTP